MVDTRALNAELQGLKDIDNSDNRLSAAIRLHAKVQAAEREISKDFTMGFYDVQKFKEIIPQVQATISRLRAGARRRAERLAERD